MIIYQQRLDIITLPHCTEIADRKSRGSKQKKVNIMDSRIYTIEESAIPEAGLHSLHLHGQNIAASENASIHNRRKINDGVFDAGTTCILPRKQFSKRTTDDEYHDKLGLFSGLRQHYSWCDGK